MPTFRFTINGQERVINAVPDMPLLWVLRDLLQLTGTKYGCGAGVCGACTVLEGHRAVRSCQIPVSQANGNSYTTIEGLSAEGRHPCQQAWIDEDVSQCGYCQAGMIMTAGRPDEFRSFGPQRDSWHRQEPTGGRDRYA